MKKWIGIGVVCIAAAGLAFVYFGGGSWVRNLLNKTATLDVCQGDDRPGCTGSEHFISCSTDVAAWAKSVRPDVCVNVVTRKLSELPGKACSYTTFEIKCSRR